MKTECGPRGMNDHAPQSEQADFFKMFKKGRFEKYSSLTIIQSPLVFIFSYLKISL